MVTGVTEDWNQHFDLYPNVVEIGRIRVVLDIARRTVTYRDKVKELNSNDCFVVGLNTYKWEGYKLLPEGYLPCVSVVRIERL